MTTTENFGDGKGVKRPFKSDYSQSPFFPIRRSGAIPNLNIFLFRSKDAQGDYLHSHYIYIYTRAGVKKQMLIVVLSRQMTNNLFFSIFY